MESNFTDLKQLKIMIEKILEIYNDELSELHIKTQHGFATPKVIESPIRLAERIVKLFAIPDVRLSCFQDVWQKWCESETTQEFDKWLHDKMHEA